MRLSPWLRERQCKRRDSSFRRRRDGAWQIIHFQRDKYSNTRLVRFSVDVGLSLRALLPAGPVLKDVRMALERGLAWFDAHVEPHAFLDCALDDAVLAADRAPGPNRRGTSQGFSAALNRRHVPGPLVGSLGAL